MKTFIASSLVCCSAGVTSSLFGMGIPSPVSWQVGICRVPLPAGLRAGWGFLLGSPLPRREECGAGAGCSCCSTSSALCTLSHLNARWRSPEGEHGKGVGRAGICKRGLGKGKEKAKPTAWERRQWSEWCLVMSMYLTESGKITKCSNVFCFLPTFHSLSSLCSLNYHVKNEPRNDWVMK